MAELDAPEPRPGDGPPQPAPDRVEDTVPSPSRPPAAKRVSSALGLLALAVSAAFGANAFGLRERFLGSETPESRPAAAGRSAGAPAPTAAERHQSVLRSQPWWQDVTTLEGVGTTTTSPFAIDRGALQWRVKWSCGSGRLSVRAPGRPKPLVDASCPGGDTGYSTRTGATTLEVTTDGPWHLEIEQQVDVPLVEPPLPAMTAPGARPVAKGSFYRMDQSGNGTVTVYRLADGTHALRLEDFYVTPNIDLEIRFSPLEAPRTSAEYLSVPASEKVAPLDVTTGAMNFTVPPSVDPTAYLSVVIWCPLIDSAYAAATLGPAQ